MAAGTAYIECYCVCLMRPIIMELNWRFLPSQTDEGFQADGSVTNTMLLAEFAEDQQETSSSNI